MGEYSHSSFLTSALDVSSPSLEVNNSPVSKKKFPQYMQQDALKKSASYWFFITQVYHNARSRKCEMCQCSTTVFMCFVCI
jgi:hypothetical protein